MLATACNEQIASKKGNLLATSGKGFRDWSVITGRGGGYKTGGGGGLVKFYPYKRGGQKRCKRFPL